MANIEIAEEKTGTQLYEDVLLGLSGDQKTLPSKYFYDERGSELFEQICGLDEYYPTDAEVEIMTRSIEEIGAVVGDGVQLIELGSGSSMKTRMLIDQLKGLKMYVPVDISGEFLDKSAEQLREEFPGLAIKPVAADYTNPFQIPDLNGFNKRVFYYPGSTIGNFTKPEARHFLEIIAKMLSPGDGVLIGVDMKKDINVLESAYNDSKGITALFNKNILHRLNRELQADFKPDDFTHRAAYNTQKGRIEMHLVSEKNQAVSIGDYTYHFKKGETIHTENSHKYSVEDFKNLTAGIFDLKNTWTDSRNYFSVHYLELD